MYNAGEFAGWRVNEGGEMQERQIASNVFSIGIEL
jgi:hypothetical protein